MILATILMALITVPLPTAPQPHHSVCADSLLSLNECLAQIYNGAQSDKLRITKIIDYGPSAEFYARQKKAEKSLAVLDAARQMTVRCLNCRVSDLPPAKNPCQAAIDDDKMKTEAQSQEDRKVFEGKFLVGFSIVILALALISLPSWSKKGRS